MSPCQGGGPGSEGGFAALRVRRLSLGCGEFAGGKVAVGFGILDSSFRWNDIVWGR